MARILENNAGKSLALFHMKFFYLYTNLYDLQSIQLLFKFIYVKELFKFIIFPHRSICIKLGEESGPSGKSRITISGY